MEQYQKYLCKCRILSNIDTSESVEAFKAFDTQTCKKWIENVLNVLNLFMWEQFITDKVTYDELL